jgi:hypothetical protein
MFCLRIPLLGLAALSFCAQVQAQTTVVLDQGLGTQIRSLPNPFDPDTPIPILAGALLTVDGSGQRTVLSDFGNAAQGPQGGGELAAVAWTPSGLLGLGQTLLVLDAFAGTNNNGALFAVNPANGQRTLVSDFGNSVQGPVGVQPIALAAVSGLLGLGSNIFVVDNDAGTGGFGAIYQINPLSGQRTLLSDFGNSAQGPVGINPVSIAVAPAGLLSVLGINAGLLVLDDDAGTNGLGEVFVVDCFGHRTVLSDFGNSAQGQVGVAPQQIATAPTGLLGLGTAIYVTDNEAGAVPSGGKIGDGALFQIAANGIRTLVSDFGNSAQGVLGEDPIGIAAASGLSGNLLVIADFAGSFPTQAKLFQINPGNGQRIVLTDCGNAARGPCSQPEQVTPLP